MKLSFFTSLFTKPKPTPTYAYAELPTPKPTSCGCDVEKYSVLVFDGGKMEEGACMNLCAKHIREACYEGKFVEFL